MLRELDFSQRALREGLLADILKSGRQGYLDQLVALRERPELDAFQCGRKRHLLQRTVFESSFFRRLVFVQDVDSQNHEPVVERCLSERPAVPERPASDLAQRRWGYEFFESAVREGKGADSVKSTILWERDLAESAAVAEGRVLDLFYVGRNLYADNSASEEAVLADRFQERR